MGYTHYWTKQKNWPAAKVSAAIQDMAEVIRRCELPLADGHGEPGTEPIIGPDFIAFNGVGELPYETFLFPGFGSPPNPDFAFCKTEPKPYDAIVVACLLVAKHHLGAAIEVSSDGDWEDEWFTGVRSSHGHGLSEGGSGAVQMAVPLSSLRVRLGAPWSPSRRIARNSPLSSTSTSKGFPVIASRGEPSGLRNRRVLKSPWASMRVRVGRPSSKVLRKARTLPALSTTSYRSALSIVGAGGAGDLARKAMTAASTRASSA